MKTLFWTNDLIIVEEKKKRLFSTKIVKREIPVNDINEISREEYQGHLNSITIFYQNNMEEFILAENCLNLEGFYSFIVKQRDLGKNIKITKIDIETLEVTEI